MEIGATLSKQIDEAKYLTAENSFRYRPILRFFYFQYEKIKYWMYKEEVFEELKKHPLFSDYTIEQLKQDLDTLVQWGNLTPIQDTSRASTVEEFKNKQFRYQLTEYSVEFERFTIKLENLSVEGASLEPTLFEKIRQEVLKIPSLSESDAKDVGAWWRNLNSDFKRLNQNYQDYIRSFHSIRVSERMKSKAFIAYKDSLILYLREFVKGLQKNAQVIENALNTLDAFVIKKVLDLAFEYEKSIPRMESVATDRDIYENIHDKWRNFNHFFLGKDGGESEVSRVLDITNDIIRKITRYASQIAESRTSAANRKEEYKKICSMFLDCKDSYSAHELSSLVFGIFRPRHFKADFIRKTESLSSGVYDEDVEELQIKPRVRTYREKSKRPAIEDKSKKKQERLREYIEQLELEKKVLDSFIIGNVLDIETLPVIGRHVRVAILKWIGKAIGRADKKAKTEDGRIFFLKSPEDERMCVLRCTDGNFHLPALKLVFEGEG